MGSFFTLMIPGISIHQIKISSISETADKSDIGYGTFVQNIHNSNLMPSANRTALSKGMIDVK